jgi:hypothetical protein
MLRRVALVRTDVSEVLIAAVIRATRIGELETTLAATSNRRTLQRSTNHMTENVIITANVLPSKLIFFCLRKKAIRSSETLVLTRATRHHIPEHGIF